ncbi:MAG: nucleotidyltransferase [Bacteroidota bacterium]
MFEKLLAALARELDAAGVPYMVIGGQAVLLYGEPRLTRDVDVTLGVGPDRLPDVLRVVETLALRPLVEPQAFVAETLVLPCSDVEGERQVDFVFSFGGYEREAIERANTAEIGGERVRFASAEDLIVLKLVAGRPRDVEDVRGILVRQPALDAAYIRRWLSAFDEALGMQTVSLFDDLAGPPPQP